MAIASSDDKAYKLGNAGTVIAHITQRDDTTLDVRLSGAPIDADDASAKIGALLGLNDDPTPFFTRAESIDWLHPLAERWRGVRPARTASLWEAGATAIIYQSVSMLSAGAVAERFIERFGRHIDCQQSDLTLFPTPQSVNAAMPAALLALGLSSAKVQVLQALATTIMSGGWNADDVALLSTAAACERFSRVRGIGPWTAAVIALRGLGRLDVFPLRDSGVVRTIDILAASAPNATAQALAVLGETRGMLYHFLLLARLEARGVLPPRAPSFSGG